jgi:hypothetical protein
MPPASRVLSRLQSHPATETKGLQYLNSSRMDASRKADAQKFERVSSQRTSTRTEPMSAATAIGTKTRRRRAYRHKHRQPQTRLYIFDMRLSLSNNCQMHKVGMQYIRYCCIAVCRQRCCRVANDISTEREGFTRMNQRQSTPSPKGRSKTP